jgi:hypothetical protein
MRPLTTPLACLLAIGGLIAFSASLASFSSGIYSSSYARSLPSCGGCHNAQPGSTQGLPELRVSLVPTARSLIASQALSVTVASTGGQTASALGGFMADVTAGAFAAGTNSRVHARTLGISHDRSSPRAWTFGYTAPAVPGLVEMAAVVNTVNGDGLRDSGDLWAFHGADGRATTGTLVRLFVNALGVAPLGASCADGYGNHPVLGAREIPTVGNQSFALQVHGAQPAAQVVVFLGANPGFPPFDLTAAGAAGCTLYVEPVLLPSVRTGAGNAERAEGAAILPLPIPANAALSGKTFEAQAAVLDGSTARSLPLTLTNALSITVQ